MGVAEGSMSIHSKQTVAYKVIIGLNCDILNDTQPFFGVFEFVSDDLHQPHDEYAFQSLTINRSV